MLVLSGIENYLGLIIIGGLLAFFGLLIFIIIQVKKHVNAFKIEKPDISEEQAAQEELDRVLVPIEDEEIVKQMDEASKEEAAKNEHKDE